MRKYLIIIALTVAVVSTACLVGETTHTLYLGPEGALQWVVLEREIRSDATDPAERQSEEAGYLQSALRGEHPAAAALEVLQPTELDSRVLRRRRPFTVITEARFPRAERLAADLLGGLGAAAETSFSIEGSERVLTVTIDVPASEQSENEGNETLHPLLGEASEYRIVLTEGRFVEAAGFRLESDDTVAIPLEPEEPGDEGDGVLVFSLRWSVE